MTEAETNKMSKPVGIYDCILKADRRVCLVKEGEFSADAGAVYNTPSNIVRLMQEHFSLADRAEENVYLLALDTKCHLIAVFPLSKGTVNSSMLGTREIFMRALLVGAKSIVLIHNHPSGDPSPSREDIAGTKRVKDAGELIGVTLLDHIIMGRNRNTSFQAEGFLV